MSVVASINAPSQRVSLPMVALVCGLLSFFLGLLVAVPGIIIGHVARAQIRDNPYRFGGARLALVGLLMCYFAGALSVVTIVYVVLNPEVLQLFADYTGHNLLLAER